MMWFNNPFWPDRGGRHQTPTFEKSSIGWCVYRLVCTCFRVWLFQEIQCSLHISLTSLGLLIWVLQSRLAAHKCKTGIYHQHSLDAVHTSLVFTYIKKHMEMEHFRDTQAPLLRHMLTGSKVFWRYILLCLYSHVWFVQYCVVSLSGFYSVWWFQYSAVPSSICFSVPKSGCFSIVGLIP